MQCIVQTIIKIRWLLVLMALALPGLAVAEVFEFGNHIDTHQITKLKIKKGEPKKLKGEFLIIFTGATDPASGLPVARHPRGTAQNEECGVDVDCEVGWDIKAVPGEAKFLFHSGINGNDHPVWLVNRVQIPQPGSFTHFPLDYFNQQ